MNHALGMQHTQSENLYSTLTFWKRGAVLSCTLGVSRFGNLCAHL